MSYIILRLNFLNNQLLSNVNHHYELEQLQLCLFVNILIITHRYPPIQEKDHLPEENIL